MHPNEFWGQVLACPVRILRSPCAPGLDFMTNSALKRPTKPVCAPHAAARHQPRAAESDTTDATDAKKEQ